MSFVLQVLSSALSRCLLHPVELFCGGVGKSFRLFFSEIPGPWQPVLMVALIIIIILVLVMSCGYRISLPFVLKFEPKTPVFLRLRSSTDQNCVEAHNDKKPIPEKCALKF